MPVLSAIALALLACSLAGKFTRRLPLYRCLGLTSIANGLVCIESVREGEWLWALLLGAMCALCLYGWWHGGGGDGTRRRLRQVRRRFEGVRRTAPTTA